MPLDAREIARLRRIIALSEKLIASSPRRKRGRPSLSKNDNGSLKPTNKRIRRTGRDLIEFRKILRKQRRSGVPVAQIAKKHGISTAYIYQL